MADEMDYMEQAKELADSYRLLVHRRDMLRQQYEDSRSWFYTKDEIIYKLSQGAHEESERVQTSGTSNPVERTVLNCDKVLASMNREVQTQRTEQFLEPYYKVCEDIELFEVGLRSLRGCTRIVAEQLFVDGRKQSEMEERMMDVIVEIYNHMDDSDKDAFTLEDAEDMVEDQIRMDKEAGREPLAYDPQFFYDTIVELMEQDAE